MRGHALVGEKLFGVPCPVGDRVANVNELDAEGIAPRLPRFGGEHLGEPLGFVEQALAKAVQSVSALAKGKTGPVLLRQTRAGRRGGELLRRRHRDVDHLLERSRVRHGDHPPLEVKGLGHLCHSCFLLWEDSDRRRTVAESQLRSAERPLRRRLSLALLARAEGKFRPGEDLAVEIKTVGIVGAGQMGSGIAQVAAQAGLAATLYDIAPPIIDRARQGMEKSLARLEEKGKLGKQTAADVLNRLKMTTSFEDLGRADVVIEAVPEDFELKKNVFQRLDALCRSEVILASNTSSISLTQIGATTKRPERVIGMHFMNPPVVLQLVEIVRSLTTSDETYAAIRTLAERMGKITILAKDYAGFIVNRILLPMINEAIYAVFEGIGSVEDIDNGMKLGTNQPMGPLALADLIGLDTCLAVLERLHSGLGEDKYRPCPLLRNYVAAGYLGRKAGKGFYAYK